MQESHQHDVQFLESLAPDSCEQELLHRVLWLARALLAPMQNEGRSQRCLRRLNSHIQVIGYSRNAESVED